MESMQRKNSELLRRKRKVMLFLPVVLIPMLTLAFYAMGGGTGRKGGKGFGFTKGLNMSLPEAKIKSKGKGLNKLGLYRQSDQDSIRMRESRKMDPYFGWKDTATADGRRSGDQPADVVVGGRMDPAHADVDAQAKELLQRLDQLKGVIGRQERGTARDSLGDALFPDRVRDAAGRLRRPELLQGPAAVPVAGLPPRERGQDVELDKLNTLMDKVLKVRYPGDAPLRDTSPEAPADRVVQASSLPGREEVVSTLAADEGEDMRTGFIDLDERPRGDTLAENMIAAVVDGAQTLVSGEGVAMRTTEDAVIGTIRVPKGSPLAGKATLSGERLLIAVNSVRIGSQVIPVSLDVVDMDGMTGIRVKGSINRDVSKESADEAVSSLGVMPVSSGVEGQATAAGIQAAKSLLSRKIRLVRVGLPAGYRVLLRNTRIKH
ncbi:MAG TPA: conjugative transposon protein TraM [Puia sp.]|jgi:hypothetical protein|nr:conjugative transposon protein TraM [Puia sp.]